MTIAELRKYVDDRIALIKNGNVNAGISNSSGILLHFIPDNFDTVTNFDETNKNQMFAIKRRFRRFQDFDTVYDIKAEEILAYTPDREYYQCLNNGIIEVFKSPIEIQNSQSYSHDYVKIDNLFYSIANFLDASVGVHRDIYQCSPPFNVVISLINIPGTYFASFENDYVTINPFRAENGLFEPFVLNDLQDNIMPEIIAGIHYSMKTANDWTKLG